MYKLVIRTIFSNSVSLIPVPGQAADNLSCWSSITKQHEMVTTATAYHPQLWVVYCDSDLGDLNTDEIKINIGFSKVEVF